jgi:hypothetical protein
MVRVGRQKAPLTPDCDVEVTYRRAKEIIMRKFSGSMRMAATTVVAVSAVVSTPNLRASAQAPANSAALAPALKTPWGEPDLQGIWTDETDTPLQRPPKYANQEFFTEAQRVEIDTARSEILGRERRAERGTERDVSGSYNNVFVSFKRAGTRTSLIGIRPMGGCHR